MVQCFFDFDFFWLSTTQELSERNISKATKPDNMQYKFNLVTRYPLPLLSGEMDRLPQNRYHDGVNPLNSHHVESLAKRLLYT